MFVVLGSGAFKKHSNWRERTNKKFKKKLHAKVWTMNRI